MAKPAYKIPSDLNASYADMEIALRSKDGIGFKPLPMKIVLAYVVGVLGAFYVMMNTFIRYGNLGHKALFLITWGLFMWLLFKTDPTQRMQFSLVPVLLNYIPKKARTVMTRRDSNCLPFYAIVGIKDIDERTGLVTFEDGTFGYWYRVVGSASILLFDSDRVAILDRVDAFYKKMNTESEVIFLTVKSAQAIYKQLAALRRLYDNLEVRDEDLIYLANEQFDVLKNYVGGTFKSIHQYMILKADNKEVLQQTKNILQSEVENSSMMIKRCIPLYREDILPVMELVYRGKGR